tara:strand:- start:572 stop:682 length:111 start_codon:yes stop_codon:yes gene_type:complete
MAELLQKYQATTGDGQGFFIQKHYENAASWSKVILV